MPNARPQRSAMSACSAVGMNGSPYFSASVRAGNTFRTPKRRSDHVDLQVPPLRRVIALCQNRRLVREARLGEELGLVPDDVDTRPAGPIVRLDDERSA